LRLARISVLCNEAQLDDDGKAGVLNGSPTETALVDMALRLGIDVRALRRRYPVVVTNHRSEGRQFMGTLHKVRGSRRLLAVKGSPLAVLNLCRFYQQGGVRLELTSEFRREVVRANDEMASMAPRVLGCAYRYGEIGRAGDAQALTWAGLLGMTDPTRGGIPELLQRLSGAGISTIMVTGDQLLTAHTLASQLGLSNGDVLETLEAAELEDRNLDELAALAGRARVFARVRPRHKLQLIRALHHAGKVVAMTGDGINDGPALRAADLGVAVGRSATEVARDVADVILDDEDPAALATAIGQGRTIYSNIRKALRFLLATT
jgi:P-type Ca2+ transporter type 2C